MKSVIYETTGRAREYCQLAMNHYSGCAHGCLYCSSPLVLHQERTVFHAGVKARVTEADIQESTERWAGNQRPVLMSFVSDPYPAIEDGLNLTRFAIYALHAAHLRFAILTKAGQRVRRDFVLYRGGDSFAVTLTFLSEAQSNHWEPGAAYPEDRLQNLMDAHDAGIPTWVSLEPVINPAETIACIHASAQWADHYKVGKLNYYPSADKTDWAAFAREAMKVLRRYNKGFYIKKDLGAYIGLPEGYREGRQLP